MDDLTEQLSQAVDWMHDQYRWLKPAYWAFVYNNRNNTELHKLVARAKRVEAQMNKEAVVCNCNDEGAPLTHTLDCAVFAEDNATRAERERKERGH
jgi:hypothetical protein